MNTNEKRFYWIKLKTDFFGREDIDFLLSQENGSDYVILYQMLCVQNANNEGRLENKIGEITIPYNIEKIVRDCKHFDIEIVNKAMELYKKLGLIYQEQDNILVISKFSEMVGSESATPTAIRQKRFRNNQKSKSVTNSNDNSNDIDNDNKVIDNNEEIRDKSIDNRDIDNTEEILEDSKLSNDNLVVESDNEVPAIVERVPYKEIIEYLNLRTNKRYSYKASKNKTVIKARFNEGYSLEDFKIVIDKMSAFWLHDEKMDMYLRPETLFSNKFDGYLNRTSKFTTKDLARIGVVNVNKVMEGWK